MKKTLIAVAMCMLLVVGAAAQDAAAKPKSAAKPKAAPGSVSKMLLDMENKMADYMKAGDWKSAAEMIDDKAVAVDENGVTDKAGWLKGMSSVKFTDAIVSDMKAVGFGDTYIVTGKFNAKGTGPDGKDMTVNVNWHDTWMKRNGKWKVVATSGTPAKS